MQSYLDFNLSKIRNQTRFGKDRSKVEENVKTGWIDNDIQWMAWKQQYSKEAKAEQTIFVETTQK